MAEKISGLWGKAAAVGLCFTATLTGQAAQAQSSFYQGECNRAYSVQDANRIDRLFNKRSYRGVSMHRYDQQVSAACKSDLVMILYLTQSTSTTESVTYKVHQKTVDVGTQPDNCSTLNINNNSITGTVTFSSELIREGDFCTINIWSDWKLSDPVTPSWVGDYSAKLQILNEGAFAVLHPPASGGKFSTPRGFTGFD